MTLTPDPELVLAPTGIAHLTRDNADLVRRAAHDAERLRVTTAAQLNGSPHIGTVTTLLAVFALTAHAADGLGLPAHIVFDALDNAPAEHTLIHGRTYTRTVGDLTAAARRISSFRRLLDFAHTASGVSYEIRSYTAYQALPPVREALHRIASRQEAFAPLAAPADGRLRVRPRCPECRLMDKAATDLRITADDHAVHLDSACPRHGRYRETIDIGGTGGWYDANTPIRSIQKGYLLAAERDTHHACPVSVDGADWGGAWHAHVLAPALALLGLPPHRWPVSLFTPMILDRTGGKLSKTLYVRYGRDYADLPPAFLDLDLLLDHHGHQALNALWNETRRWAAEPARLHRSYTAEYLAALLPTAPGTARAAS